MNDLREEFFEGLGFHGDKPMVERRDGGYITEVRARAPSTTEYRTEHLTLPPLPSGRSPAEYERRFEQLMALIRETDRLEALAG